jgi:hypothetical protein
MYQRLAATAIRYALMDIDCRGSDLRIMIHHAARPRKEEDLCIWYKHNMYQRLAVYHVARPRKEEDLCIWYKHNLYQRLAVYHAARPRKEEDLCIWYKHNLYQRLAAATAAVERSISGIEEDVFFPFFCACDSICSYGDRLPRI